MTNEEKKKAYCMLIDGATYQEVGDEIGISKQAIHQQFSGLLKGRSFSGTRKNKYKNIEKFMIENNINRKNFAECTGLNYQNFCKILRAETEPTKQTIDKILKFTGMTYEQAFAEEG